MNAVNNEKNDAKKDMMKFIKFVGKLPKESINYDIKYSTACPICKGKFIFSKTSYNGHMGGGCTKCHICFTE
jgi:hypothetical protein